MILTCPSCGTQYAVKDGSIPPAGRKVRCAACGHSWHQEPDQQPEPKPEAPPRFEAPPEPASGPDEVPPVTDPEPAGQEPEVPFSAPDEDPGEDETPAYEEREPEAPESMLVDPPTAVPVPPPEAWPEQPNYEEQFDLNKELPDAEEIAAVHEESGSDRKRSWLMGILIAILVVAAIVIALWALAPDSLRQRVGFAAAAPTPLQIAPGVPERQKLASGNELVVVSGRVINPSSKVQSVPPIEAQLRDKSGRLIYSWTIAPPTRSLPPGGSASFNSAEMDVPPSGLDSTVTLTLKS